jgi:hypothetical protein
MPAAGDTADNNALRLTATATVMGDTGIHFCTIGNLDSKPPKLNVYLLDDYRGRKRDDYRTTF